VQSDPTEFPEPLNARERNRLGRTADTLIEFEGQIKSFLGSKGWCLGEVIEVLRRLEEGQEPSW